MNLKLFEKASQSPEAVRLIYRALDKDPGPLTKQEPNSVLDNDMWCPATCFLDQHGTKYRISIFGDISAYLEASSVLTAWYVVNYGDITANMISFIVQDYGALIASLDVGITKIREKFHLDDAREPGLTLMFCPDSNILDDVSADVAEMVRLFRGEDIEPSTELGIMLKALDD